MLRIVVLSPLPAVRAGLRALLMDADDLQVVGEVDASEAPPEPTALRPDVVLVDAQSTADLDLAMSADAANGGPGLVILGPVPGDERLPVALAGRAWAYIPRHANGEQLAAAIRAVGKGMVVVDPVLGGHLFARAARSEDALDDEAGQELTGREREVLQLVALGLPNKMIAARLGISEHTVKFHVAAVLGKLGAGSRTEAVHLGARRGLVVL